SRRIPPARLRAISGLAPPDGMAQAAAARPQAAPASAPTGDALPLAEDAPGHSVGGVRGRPRRYRPPAPPETDLSPYPTGQDAVPMPADEKPPRCPPRLRPP